jgi:hypothetical protein
MRTNQTPSTSTSISSSTWTPAQHRTAADANLKAVQSAFYEDFKETRDHVLGLLGPFGVFHVALGDVTNLALLPPKVAYHGLQAIHHGAAAAKGQANITRLQDQIQSLARQLQAPNADNAVLQKAIVKTAEALAKIDPKGSRATVAQISGDYRQVGSTDPENSVPNFQVDRGSLKQSIGPDGTEVSFSNGNLLSPGPGGVQPGPAAFGIVRNWLDGERPGKFTVTIKNFLVGPPVPADQAASSAFSSGRYAQLPGPPVKAPVDLLYFGRTEDGGNLLVYRAPAAQSPGTTNLFVLKSGSA